LLAARFGEVPLTTLKLHPKEHRPLFWGPRN
jgi:hypothetical protein